MCHLLQIAPILPDWNIFPALMVLGLPFISFLAALVLGKKRIRLGSSLSLVFMLMAFGFALYQAFLGWKSPLHTRFHWLEFGEEGKEMLLTGGIYIDRLSALLAVLVTGISSLVLLYSQVYMRDERHLDRYWAYLSFFVFAMLGIVLADNLLFVFIFWELVGLSSYLLIGFWFEKESASRASQKAFLLNRIGDVAFFAGMLLIFAQTGSLDMGFLIDLAQNSETLSPAGREWLSLGGMLLIGGAIGKSAQFPLQVWLPDAMEGPTPVSSLIHAATMVAAGIYLLARYYFLLNPYALNIIVAIGSLTSLMAAIAALSQWDIKKVLAYSTLSQLGYMMVGLGVGAWGMALFHLFTHAFFKCALFLVAGALIHSRHSQPSQDGESNPGILYENDMRQMGDYRRKLPGLFWVYLPPMLALAGLPLFSGFLSKDGIILASFGWAGHEGGVAWLVPVSAMLTAFLTAYYIGRLAMLVFAGPTKEGSLKGSLSWKMLLPIGILSAFSCWIAFSLNPLDGEDSWLLRGLQVIRGETGHHENPYHFVVLGLSVFLATSGLMLAYFRFRKGVPQGKMPGFMLSFEHFYQDWFYEKVLGRAFVGISRLAAWFDRVVVDGFFTIFSRMTVNKSPQIDSLGEASREADESMDERIDRVGHLLGPSLATFSSKIDHVFIDGLVNGLVGGLLRIGKRTSRTQKRSVQGYLTGIVIGLMAVLGIIFWILF